MTLRRLVLLALAALLATGGAFWLSSQRHLERAVRAGDPLLPQLRGALNEVTEVRISRGDGARVTLQRGADGWSVLERSYLADAGKVRKLLLDLVALEIVEEKTHDPARHAVLGVEDVDTPAAGGTRLDVKKASGEVQSLIVGKASGAREGYVRLASAAPSFLARPQVGAEANPARWLDATLLDLDPTRLRSATVSLPGQASRTLEGTALPAALAGAVKSLALEDVRVRPLEAAHARVDDAATPRVRLVTVDGLVLDIEGREDGGRRWISLRVTVDPAAALPPPNPATPAAATVPRDPRTDAAALARRFEGREFEIPAYRYSALFEPAAAGS
jgi:hypothetical protein